MKNQTPLVSIISINYNSKAETLDFIDSLKKLNYKNRELIIVDNASDENPEKEIKKALPEARMITSSQNLGFAGGNNLALEYSRGEYIFFVNNDTVLSEDCLDILIETATKLPKLGALSPKFEFYHTPGMVEYAGSTNINKFTARNRGIGSRTYNPELKGLIETSYMHGGGMLVPRKVIDDIGPMSEDFFLYYEEMDWSERMRRSGYKIYCQRDAVIYHKESASVGRENPLKTFYMNRNRILFMRRNYSPLELVPFIAFFGLVSFPKNVLSYLLRGKLDHLKAFCKGVFYHFNSNISY